MNKEELIVKQQLEIEELKITIIAYKNACHNARDYLLRPGYWSTTCQDFPKVAMMGIMQARQALDEV